MTAPSKTQNTHTRCAVPHCLAAPSLAALLLALAPLLPAQQTPAMDDANDEVVVLSEFTVSSRKLENSYIATETTATRIGDKTIDLPYAIDIFTEDFIQDFNAYSDDTILSYIPSTTGGATGSSDVKIRGFSILKTRDGFQYAMPAASHVTKEVIQGPASIIYGRATPGGILNTISPRPRQKPSVKVRTAIDTNNDNFTASLVATGPVAGGGGKLFYHAYLEYKYGEALEKYVHSTDWFAGLSLLYRFNRNTALTFTFEYQPTRGADSGGPPILVNSAGITTANGYSAAQVNNLNNFIAGTIPAGTIPGPNANNKGIRYWHGTGDFSTQGPDNLREVQFYGANLLFEHRFNSVWSFRLSGQTKHKDTDKTIWAPPAYLYDTAWKTGQRVPRWQNQWENAYSGGADLLGRFATSFITPISHRILLAADANYQTNFNEIHEAAGDTLASIPARSRYLDFYDPYYAPFDFGLLRHGTLFINDATTPDGNYTYPTHQKMITTSQGALASYRAAMFGDRLIAMASLRLDYCYDRLDNRRPGYLAYSTRRDHEQTHSLGLLYKIAGDRLLAYANNSTGFNPQNRADLGTGELVPAETSAGYEVGVKGATPDNNINYSLAAYRVELENVSYTNPDYFSGMEGSGTPQYIQHGKQRAQGLQATAILRLEGGTYLRFALGCTDAKTIDTNDQYALGKPMTNIAKWNGAILFSHEVRTGPWSGLRYGGSVTSRDGVLLTYESNAVYGVNLPSLTLFNAFIGYKWKSTAFWGPRTVSHNINLNFTNLLGEAYYLGGRRANGLTAALNYTFTY
jgi:iron complex outermembrane receptor protein